MILNCSWNGEPFECCDIFLPLKTEFGTCYTINSVNTNPRYGKRLISNRLNGPGMLKLSVSEDIDVSVPISNIVFASQSPVSILFQIHFHSPDDVPFAFEERELKDSILWGSVKSYIIKVYGCEIIGSHSFYSLCFLFSILDYRNGKRSKCG